MAAGAFLTITTFISILIVTYIDNNFEKERLDKSISINNHSFNRKKDVGLLAKITSLPYVLISFYLKLDFLAFRYNIST